MRAAPRERDLVDWLAQYLLRAGADVAREVPSGSGRVDLVVIAEYEAAIEVKAITDRQTLCLALGQALAYRASGFDRVALAIPHATISQNMLDAYEAYGVQILECDMTPRAYTAIQPAFPSLYPQDFTCSMPWGRVKAPHAHLASRIAAFLAQ